MAEKLSKIKVRKNIQVGTALVFYELTKCFLLPLVLQYHWKNKKQIQSLLQSS